MMCMEEGSSSEKKGQVRARVPAPAFADETVRQLINNLRETPSPSTLRLSFRTSSPGVAVVVNIIVHRVEHLPGKTALRANGASLRLHFN